MGRLPFWNPYLFSAPLLANPQTAVLYPPYPAADLAAGHEADLLERSAAHLAAGAGGCCVAAAMGLRLCTGADDGLCWQAAVSWAGSSGTSTS